MKNTYIAVIVEENGKYNAFGVKLGEHQDVLHRLQIKGIKNALIAKTKKECAALVSDWNKSFIANGTAMFDKDYCYIQD